MNRNTLTLTITSLLAIILSIFHLADDIVRGYEKGGRMNLVIVPICVLWLYATLLLRERRTGYIIIILASLLAAYIPWVHMGGKGVGIQNPHLANTSGVFFFVSTLLALGVTGLFSAILAIRGLWFTRKAKA